MRIAIVGCGFVADYYLSTLSNHPELELIGVHDLDASRASGFARRTSGAVVYGSLQALLEDPRIELVLNLTSPAAHFTTTRACLLAGKHVYSEKPLALDLEQAQELAELAVQCGLSLSGAPCTLLGEAAQTVWRLLRDDALGQVRLVYAEMDDGMMHRLNYRDWSSPSGLPWPYRDEFELGCTVAHAAYVVSWLVAFFGPARRVSAFASCQVPNPRIEPPIAECPPDLTVSCIEFASGVVARLTCSALAGTDRRLRIFGDDATLECRNVWDFGSPLYLNRPGRWRTWIERHSRIGGAISRRLGYRHRLLRAARFASYPRNQHHIDFCRGVAEQAAAIRERRSCRLSASFLLHVTEILLSIRRAAESGTPLVLATSCEPIDPMPWALGAPEENRPGSRNPGAGATV
jgi:predicted dehydrogenase